MTAAVQPPAKNSNADCRSASGTWRRPPGLPVLTDIETLAASLGISVRHVRRLVAERRIPFVKVGNLVRFDVHEVAQWVVERRVPVFDPSSVRRRRR